MRSLYLGTAGLCPALHPVVMRGATAIRRDLASHAAEHIVGKGGPFGYTAAGEIGPAFLHDPSQRVVLGLDADRGAV